MRPALKWHIITGEYPPQLGGVSDYTRQLARGLAEAGDEVHVWAPHCREPAPVDQGVQVHRLPGHFGPRALWHLDRALRRQPAGCRILVQYVPHMYGWKAMNVAFCLWLWARCRPRPWIMFHEVAFPCAWGQPIRHNILGFITHAMAALIARAAAKVFVSTHWWIKRLRRLAPGQRSITWLPIPSNVSTDSPPAEVAALRTKWFPHPNAQVIGHFGTYGASVTDQLAVVLPVLLRARNCRQAFFVGQGSEGFCERMQRANPDVAPQMHATGRLDAAAVAVHLRACDLLIQPYPDGVSTRRTSLMSGLALGIPIVTTRGPATEPLWERQGLVALASADQPDAIVEAAEQLLRDHLARFRLADRACIGYQVHFSLCHTIETLRSIAKAVCSN